MIQETISKSLKYHVRKAVKKIAVRSGGLSLFHRLTHREVLTVLMFHRVLPPTMMTSAEVDKEYTVSTDLLHGLLGFIASHYNIVSLADVLRSRRRQAPLPVCPLLVTFDDGWSDNAMYASPILASAGVPWTLFAATEAISSGQLWWQEALLNAVRLRRVTYEDLFAAGRAAATDPDKTFPAEPGLAILLLYAQLPWEKREELIARYCLADEETLADRDMADWAVLRMLKNSGVGIGGHGASHLPLTLIADPRGDLIKAQNEMQKELGDFPTTMSFPHGRYSYAIVEEAKKLGMELLFTSDPVLNKCPGGWLESDLLGRISISTASVADANGALKLEYAMPWLMLRP